MTIDHAARRRQFPLRRSRGAVAALTGALALLASFLAVPAVADGADPDSPFTLPSLRVGNGWQNLISSPGNADYLRTGGVACPRPAPLAASNAGSGHGYRVPFIMALTDGRALAGYSPVSLKAGLFPFGAGAFGVTGWVRGWVNLPSLRIEVPDDGTTLCSPSGVYWLGLGPTDYGEVVFRSLGAAPDFEDGVTGRAWTELVPVGTPQASITGVDQSGALDLQASMTVEVHAMMPNFAVGMNDCTFTVDMSLSTVEESLPTSFPKADGLVPAEPAKWASRGLYDKYYSDPFDMQSAPPDRYYMPPNALRGAIVGQTATVANVAMSMPPPSPPTAPRSGRCDNVLGSTFATTIQGVLLPRSGVSGAQQPTRSEQQCSPSGCVQRNYSLIPVPNNLGLVETPAGAVQTSVDITIADIGMPRGLPTGFGFS